MKLFVKYRKVFEGIVAVLFLVASSGFTVVLHSCLMDEMTCCNSPMQKSVGDRISGQMPESCCNTTIVGGLNTNPAVSEKQNLTDTHKLQFVAAIPTMNSCITDAGEAGSTFHAILATVYSPPLEKYVLNVSFLI